MLAGEHRAARGHADNVLWMSPVVGDAMGAQEIDRGRAGNCSTVASERVVALLIGGDEENLASHLHLSIKHVFEFLQADTGRSADW